MTPFLAYVAEHYNVVPEDYNMVPEVIMGFFESTAHLISR